MHKSRGFLMLLSFPIILILFWLVSKVTGVAMTEQPNWVNLIVFLASPALAMWIYIKVGTYFEDKANEKKEIERKEKNRFRRLNPKKPRHKKKNE